MCVKFGVKQKSINLLDYNPYFAHSATSLAESHCRNIISSEALSQEHALGPVWDFEICLVQNAASLLQMVWKAWPHIFDLVRELILSLLT